jgi:putative transposase
LNADDRRTQTPAITLKSFGVISGHDADRFGSVRDECLSKVIALGEKHLRELLREFLAHYHRERNHQGVANRLIEPSNDNTTTSGRIARRIRIGGLPNYYCREAA